MSCDHTLLLEDQDNIRKRLLRMRRGVIAAARVIERLVTDDAQDYSASMVTLTYAEGSTWEAGHIRSLLKHYREWFRARKFPFYAVWTAELQPKRLRAGASPEQAMHYHIVMWLPVGVNPPFPDQQGWWSHGQSKCIFARSPVGYIAKYASKLDGKGQLTMPKGARLWGHCGIPLVERAEIAFAQAPRWLKGVIHHTDHPRRVIRDFMEPNRKGDMKPVRVGGWLSKLSGAFFIGPWLPDRFASGAFKCLHTGFIEVHFPCGSSFRINHAPSH